MQPIRIYLDTSDYSEMLYAAPGSEIEKIKFQLIDWVDEGKIETGCSFWLIAELIQEGDVVKFLKDRRNRGALIKRLAKGKSFPHTLDLKSGARFPNGGVWMINSGVRHLEGTFDQFAENFKESLKERADQRAPNRKERRAAQKKLKNEKLLRSEILKWKLSRSDFLPMPVSDDFVEGKYLQKHLAGDITRKDFDLALKGWVSDPELYFELFHKHLSQPNPIADIRENFYNTLKTLIEKLLEAQNNFKASQKIARSKRREYHKVLRNSDLSGEIIGMLKLPDLNDSELNFGDFQLSQMLEDILPEGQTEYFDEYFSSLLSGAKIEKSDLGDLMHMQHIFDCDLFRCDVKKAKLFQNSKALPSERIVPTLRELPDRIRALIE